MDELDPLERVAVYRWPIALAVLAALSVLLYLLQPILTPFVLGG